MYSCFVTRKSITKYGSLIIRKYCDTQRSRTIEVGSKGILSKTFTKDDVKVFATLSGDTNPLHLDPQYAATTKFGQCVVHGALINGLVSAVMGTVVPGPGTILVHQEINYTKPLFIGEKVSAEVIVNDIKKRVVNCSYRCFTDDGKAVVNGIARVIIT